MTTEDVDYVPTGTLGYDVVRLALALRLAGYALRHACRDAVLGLVLVGRR